MNTRQIGLFNAFAEHRVEYAVVGGVAVNAYGYVRATQDLDVFIRSTQEKAQRKASHRGRLLFFVVK